MAFCGQYPRKGLHILRRGYAWHTSIWNLSSTTQHAQNVKIWSYCTFCAVTVWKRHLKRLLLWGRKNKENTSNEDGLVLVYVLPLFIRSLLCASGFYAICTDRRGYLPLCVLIVNTIGLVSCPHPVQPGNKIFNCVLPLTHEGVWTGLLTTVILR